MTLRNDLIQIITQRHQSTPRHLQAELGPSELGHPCTRHMAYALTNDPLPRCNPQWDPLPSIIGMAIHAWLAEAAILANTVLGRDRWLVETKVHPAEWISGHADLFDTDSGTVIDWKVPGVNQFGILSREMSADLQGPGPHVRAWIPARRPHGQQVAVMLLPRGGSLSGAHLWSEPYNEKLADEMLARRQRIIEQIKVFDVEHHPERYEWFEKKAYNCLFCPWFSPKPDGPLQCSGEDVAPPIP